MHTLAKGIKAIQKHIQNIKGQKIWFCACVGWVSESIKKSNQIFSLLSFTNVLMLLAIKRLLHDREKFSKNFTQATSFFFARR